MKQITQPNVFGTLLEPEVLRIERLLPGPIERVWSYLTDGELRRQWLAAGPMELEVGAAFELVWRNSELTTPPGERPPGFGDEHRMKSHILALDAPHHLAFTWGEKETSEVSFDLSQEGEDVRLVVVHRRVTDKKILLRVSSGWHAHLDVLVARIRGAVPTPFWDHFSALHAEYERRLSGV